MCVIYLCLDLDRFFRECDGERERVLDLLERLDLLDERFLFSGRNNQNSHQLKRKTFWESITVWECPGLSGQTWLNGSSNGWLSLSNFLHDVLQLFGRSLWRELWRLHYGIIGMVNSEKKKDDVMLITYYLNTYYWMLAHGWNRMHNASELSFSMENTHLSGLSPNMTPLNVSARATDSWSENSTKAKRVGCVSSPAILTNFTSPTCLKNSRSCSAVVLYRRKTKQVQHVLERQKRILRQFQYQF